MPFSRLSIVGIFLLSLLCLTACGGKSSPPTEEKNSILKELPIPEDAQTMGIKLFPKGDSASNWSAYRTWPDGRLKIYNETFQFNPKNIDDTGFSRILPRSFIRLGSEIAIIAYNPDKYKYGDSHAVEIWKTDSIEGTLKLFADNLTIGGIEDYLTAGFQQDDLTACDSNACVSISGNGQSTSWAISEELIGKIIVEAIFVKDGAYVILRSNLSEVNKGNSPYEVKFLPSPRSVSQARVEANIKDCVPFNLQADGSGVHWSCARTQTELADLFEFDLMRLPHGGINDLGLNNDHGRIAWSQIYTIGALIHLSERYTPNLWRARDWRPIKEISIAGVDLIARQGSEGLSGYYSTRYSVGSERLLFAVHLGRIAALLEDAREDGNTSAVIEATSAAVNSELISLSSTVETWGTEGPFSTLRLRKGSSFWADGVNAPYNFLSAYATGLLSTNIVGIESRCAELLKPLITLEHISIDPDWHYWWGLGASGWTASMNVSRNTPDFEGDHSIANISYRSMDATALLQLYFQTAPLINSETIEALHEYVIAGQLLPSVNLQFVKAGKPAILNTNAALVHARSAAPWEIEDQLFALESLAKSWGYQ